MIITLAVVSVVAFVLIQLPPGDFLTAKIAEMEAMGTRYNMAEVAVLRKQYGLDQPMALQYTNWMKNIITRGDLGMSFKWDVPVTEVLGERLVLTAIVFICSVAISYLLAIVVGAYSATHQYSIGDYATMILCFIGMSIPTFFLAMLMSFVFFKYFDLSVGGIVSPEYIDAPFGVAKLLDMCKHLIVPIFVITAGSAVRLIRIMRANMLDELSKLYVTTARAKGLPERRLILKYPLRVALNPIISTLGTMMPWIIGVQTIVSIVLNLPTFGPLLLDSLLFQDMYLAGSIVLIQTTVVVVATFVSDMLLVWADPRIRLGKGAM